MIDFSKIEVFFHDKCTCVDKSSLFIKVYVITHTPVEYGLNKSLEIQRRKPSKRISIGSGNMNCIFVQQTLNRITEIKCQKPFLDN